MGHINVRNRIIDHHLVLNGYGTSLSNDIRGSGSIEIRKPELRDLGPIHFGRKIVQPTRTDLRAFHRAAGSLLDFDVSWFEESARAIIAAAVAEVIRVNGYTCFAFGACSNHAHGMFRVHRESGEVMWDKIANATRDALRSSGMFSEDHPVWSSRLYVVYKKDVRSVEAGVEYFESNPIKEGLPRQFHKFVVPYDGWPYHHKR